MFDVSHDDSEPVNRRTWPSDVTGCLKFVFVQVTPSSGIPHIKLFSGILQIYKKLTECLLSMQGAVLGADSVVWQHSLSSSLCDISLWKNGNLARIAYS